MNHLEPEEIDDIAAVLRAELPDDSCKSQLGLLIYGEVVILRWMVDQMAEQITAMSAMPPSKQQFIDKLRTKYVSEKKDTGICGSQ